jgi:hypothetical protein
LAMGLMNKKGRRRRTYLLCLVLLLSSGVSYAGFDWMAWLPGCLHFISPSHRRAEALRRQFKASVSSVQVAVREGSDRAFLRYAYLYQVAEKIDAQSSRRPGIAFRVELQNEKGITLARRSIYFEGQIADYSSWRFDGNILIGDSLKNEVRRLMADNGEYRVNALSEVAQVSIFVARAAGGEIAEHTKEIVVRVAETAIRLGLQVPIHLNLVENRHPSIQITTYSFTPP